MIGERIRTMRKAAGLTQGELAEGAGLSQPFLSQVEKGTKNPRLENLEGLARALKTNVSSLMGEGGAIAANGNNHGGVGG